MPRSSLSDEEVADIRALHAEGGHTLQALADRFGVSKEHVGRIVRGESRQELPEVDLSGPSVVATTLAWLEAAEFDPDASVDAAVAVALAEKVDAMRAATSAQSGVALPGLVLRLRDALGALGALSGGVGEPRIDLRGDDAIRFAKWAGLSVRAADGLAYCAADAPSAEVLNVRRFNAVDYSRAQYRRRLAFGSGVWSPVERRNEGR